jgi:hypothetical protein
VIISLFVSFQVEMPMETSGDPTSIHSCTALTIEQTLSDDH